MAERGQLSSSFPFFSFFFFCYCCWWFILFFFCFFDFLLFSEFQRPIRSARLGRTARQRVRKWRWARRIRIWTLNSAGRDDASGWWLKKVERLPTAVTLRRVRWVVSGSSGFLLLLFFLFLLDSISEIPGIHRVLFSFSSLDLLPEAGDPRGD